MTITIHTVSLFYTLMANYSGSGVWLRGRHHHRDTHWTHGSSTDGIADGASKRIFGKIESQSGLALADMVMVGGVIDSNF